MPLMSLEEQVNQAQFGLQLTDEEREAQIQAIEEAFEESIAEYNGENA